VELIKNSQRLRDLSMIKTEREGLVLRGRKIITKSHVEGKLPVS